MAHEGAFFTPQRIRDRFTELGSSLRGEVFGGLDPWKSQLSSSFITGDPVLNTGWGGQRSRQKQPGFFPTALRKAYGGESWTGEQLEDYLRNVDLYGVGSGTWEGIGQTSGFGSTRNSFGVGNLRSGAIGQYGRQLLSTPRGDWDTHDEGVDPDLPPQSPAYNPETQTFSVSDMDLQGQQSMGGYAYPVSQELLAYGRPADQQTQPLSLLDMATLQGRRVEEQSAMSDINRKFQQSMGKYTSRYGAGARELTSSEQMKEFPTLALGSAEVLAGIRAKSLKEDWTKRMEATKLESQIDLETTRIFGNLGLGAAEIAQEGEGLVASKQKAWLESVLGATSYLQPSNLVRAQ